MWYNYNNEDKFRVKINTTQPKGEQNVKRNRSTPATHRQQPRAQQPPRPRARDTFSCVVDDTAPNVMPFTPPPYYTAVNPCHSRQERDSGGEPYTQLQHDRKGRAYKTRSSYSPLAAPRIRKNAPATGLFALQRPPLQRRSPPALFRGKLSPHSGY